MQRPLRALPGALLSSFPEPLLSLSILVTGASGYVGGALIPRLVAEGHDVRALARDPSRLDAGVPVYEGDAVTGRGLARALEGAEVVYYLIHSMEPDSDDGFAERELRAARNVVEAGAPRRIVYLGGLVPADARPSPHLRSRLAVERALLHGVPDSVALRASIVIGARSRSFRFLVRLIERLPVLALPAWREHRTAPVDGRDVLAALVAAATAPVRGSYDLAGPDVMTYAAMIERIRDHLLVSRPSLGLPLSATPLASRVAAALAGEQHELIGPLMEGLEEDLLPRPGCDAAATLGVRMHRFDAAVERALREWESVEELAAR